MNIVDQKIKRRFVPEMKLKSFWLNDVEASKDDSETISILIRELVRLEHVVGTGSVLLILNMMLTVGLLVAVLLSALGSGVDSSMASKVFGVAKGIIGGK
jgi:hypothetical protein